MPRCLVSSPSFRVLRDFITRKMRMSHIYQPVMIKTLIKNGGAASLRQIAAEFLTQDESQLEYYEEITKAMPGKVLAKHHLVKKIDNTYSLVPDVSELSKEEKAEIIHLCDEAVDRYLTKRGTAAYDHRRQALGYISGSLRYEVLKRSGGRCDLCGISVEERAIEVDHILPRKHGGTDDSVNLQALCWKCNANKGARDATNFRAMKDSLSDRDPQCVFCTLSDVRIVASNTLAQAFRDAYPVTHLHTLVIPKRHVSTYFDLYTSERRGVEHLLDELRADILKRDQSVEGFNVGINNGEVAGQTVAHCHIHVIPRRRGDVSDPTGGVRGVIPGKAAY